MSNASIAIVGGGMFGVAAAIEVAEAGNDVTVFEQSGSLLSAASNSNQWRLHRGYHYPQSERTAREAKESEPAFRDRFGEAVISEQEHYYAIANESWVGYDEYVEFCDRLGLDYEPVELDLVSDETIQQTLQVAENHVSPDRLRQLCWNEIESLDIDVRLHTRVTSLDDLSEYDYRIVATYAGINELLPAGHPLRRKYRFEVCEIPVVTLPKRYHGTNIIVVYGPFMSTDHWGDSPLFAMGDYHNMVHHSNVGYEPEIPDEYERLVNKGLVKSSTVTNVSEFQSYGQQFIPGVAESRYVGSMFTIRSKLPDVEDTDARPSLVHRQDDLITIFGGKLATSIQTARDARDEIA